MVIYKTTNTINGMFYVGKDSLNNPNYLGSGIKLERAVKKYGRENFRKDILEECNSPEHLNEREVFWIAFFQSSNPRIGYNLTAGGTGGNTSINATKEQKEKRIKALSDGGKKWLENGGREFLSEKTAKMWKNEAIRSTIIKKLTGREITWGDKIGEGIRRYRKTHPYPPVSEARREKISKAFKGKEFTKIDAEVEALIVELYKGVGCVRMSKILSQRGISVSPYLICRTLKKLGVYQKGRKRMGSKEDTKRIMQNPLGEEPPPS